MQTIENPNSTSYWRPLWLERQLRGYVIDWQTPWIKLIYHTFATDRKLASTGRVDVIGLTAYDIAVTESIPLTSVAAVVVGKPR